MTTHRWEDTRHKRTPAGEAAVERLRGEIIEQVTLRQLRDLLGLTQVELAARMEAPQAQLSAIEKRDDRLVSTMRRYVEALGGKLRLQAVFEGGKVLEISEQALGVEARTRGMATAEAA
jgi:transcriptional regulator with XRE-family HTH domain